MGKKTVPAAKTAPATKPAAKTAPAKTAPCTKGACKSPKASTKATYIVRSGTHNGQYIGISQRNTISRKKYSWVNTRSSATRLSLHQAVGIIRAYGGEIVKA